MSERIKGYSKLVDVTPTISTAQYAANDQVGGIMTLSAAALVPPTGGGSETTLVKLAVIDKAKQSAALTVFLFQSLPTVASSDNAALDIADAQMSNCVGAVRITAADYDSVNASCVGTLNIAETGLLCRSEDAAGHLYAVAMTTGTPTYDTTTALTFRFGFAQD